MKDEEIREAFEKSDPYKESKSVIQVTKRFEIFKEGYKAGMKSEALEKAVELLKELLDDYKSYYHLLPNSHRKTPEEYFKTEIDFLKEQEK